MISHVWLPESTHMFNIFHPETPTVVGSAWFCDHELPSSRRSSEARSNPGPTDTAGDSQLDYWHGPKTSRISIQRIVCQVPQHLQQLGFHPWRVLNLWHCAWVSRLSSKPLATSAVSLVPHSTQNGQLKRLKVLAKRNETQLGAGMF